MAEETESPSPIVPKKGGKWYKEMIGPLPAGAWIGIVAVGLGASYYRKRHGVSTTTATPSTSTATGMLPMTDQTMGNPGGGGGGGGSSPTSGPTLQPITDNMQWYRQAESVLIGRGFDPSLVDTALRKYINGEQLTGAENAIINEALTLIGPLPNPPPSPGPPTPIPPGSGPTIPVATPTQPHTPAPSAPPSEPIDHYATGGDNNLEVIETGNALIYTGVDVSAFIDTLAKRIHDGHLSIGDPKFFGSQDPTTEPLAIQGLVWGRLHQLGWG